MVLVRSNLHAAVCRCCFQEFSPFAVKKNKEKRKEKERKKAPELILGINLRHRPQVLFWSLAFRARQKQLLLIISPFKNNTSCSIKQQQILVCMCDCQREIGRYMCACACPIPMQQVAFLFSSCVGLIGERRRRPHEPYE